jgi:hypothetical protein
LILLLALLSTCVLAMPAVSDAHRLTYRRAKRAAKRKGAQIAGKPVRVSAMIRITRHRYFAQVKWTRTDPNGCVDCGYDPYTGTTYDTPTTEHCFADLRVRFRSRHSYRVRTTVIDKVCS